MAQLLDIFVFTLFILYVIVDFYKNYDLDLENFILNRLNSLANILNDPYAFIKLFFFMGVFYSIIYSVGLPMDDNKSFSVMIVENIVLIIVVVLIIIYFFKYILNIDIIDVVIINNLTPSPHPNTVSPTHMSNNNEYIYNSSDSNGVYDFDVKIKDELKNVIIPDVNNIENKLNNLNFGKNSFTPASIYNTTTPIISQIPTGTISLGTIPSITTTMPVIIPQTTMPGNTTPFGTTPFGTTPGSTTPGSTTPFGTTPGSTTPFGTTPGETTPFGTTPGSTTPFGTTPGSTTPFGTTPGSKTPFGTTPGSTTPGKTMANLKDVIINVVKNMP
jgi:hypothetical protein